VVAEGTADELKWQLEGERVTLTYADAVSYSLALADLDPEYVVEGDPAKHALSVATDGSAAQVRHLLDRMDKLGAEVDKVAVERPSLDDVFLALTSTGGRR
jgi:ABC-2 type transport system ATP-binding protein